jgi:hypothetical protein
MPYLYAFESGAVMGTVIRFPNQRLGERLEPLREFLDYAEAEQRAELAAADLEELEWAIEWAWPGAVAIEQSWVTKLLFVFAGFAIGIGIHP